jgi:hypothetical protein
MLDYILNIIGYAYTYGIYIFLAVVAVIIVVVNFMPGNRET